jgi:uncharacterized protein
MTAEQIQPIASGKRTAIVDMLRGWALLGVCLMNYTDYSFFDKVGKQVATKPDVLTTVLQIVGFIVFQAKSWTMLSMLFGYGFAVLIKNVANKGYNPVWFFTKRMLWLFVIAFINCCFWWGDILKDYAFMGLVLLFFYKMKPKPAFILAIVLLLLLPGVVQLVNKIPSKSYEDFNKLIPLYHSKGFLANVKFHLLGTWYREVISPGYLYSVHLVQLICFLVGFSAQGIGFFENLADNKQYLKRIFWWSLVVAILMVGLFILNRIIIKKFKFDYFKYYAPFYWFILASMIFITASLCWLYINGKLKSFFKAMERIGKMTLTNYMVQNVISFFVFGGVGFGLGSTMPYWFYLALPFCIYVVQVYLSKWWLNNFNYGPMEWLWRQASYGKILPLKKEKGVKVVG